MGEAAKIAGDDTLESILDSGVDIEWQSWPWGMSRPNLYAEGRLQASWEIVRQLMDWYPNFAFRVTNNQMS